MARVTIEIPDELGEKLAEVSDRLPELLGLSLQQPAIPARVYRYILEFLTSQPTPEQIAAFRPTSEMQNRLQTLLEREKSGTLTHLEKQELDEYEQIEHFVVMLKAANRR